MVNPAGRSTLEVMHRFLLPLVLVGCGGAVAPETTKSDPTVVVEKTPVEWRETAACSAIAAACTTDPAVLVHGVASGLPAELEGARVEFAIRYLNEEGMGLAVPHGVTIGRTHVEGGAFDTCVCVPRGANMYPEVAAVVYTPGSKSETVNDVARATYSQRYATLGREDVGYALKAVPSQLQKTAAVAAMVERTAKVALKNLGTVSGTVVAGLIADERPLAAQLVARGIEAGATELTWTMPGRAYSSERVAFFVDRNWNGRCDAADVGGFAPTSGEFAGSWLSGPSLTPVCDALQPGASRE